MEQFGAIRIMRKTTHIFIFIIGFIFLGTALGQAEFTEKILAVINGEIITQTDVDEILGPIYIQYQSTYQGKDLQKKLEIAKTDILDQLIEDKLMLQQAKKEELQIDEKEIDRLLDGVKSNFQSPEEFDNVLSTRNITLSDLKKSYTEQLLIKKLVNKEVLSKITISPLEVSEYYEANKEEFKIPEKLRLRDIFIKTEHTAKDKEEEEIIKKANDIHEQLKSGVEFIELVEKYSEDLNVVDAGDMGYMQKGTLQKKIEDAVFALEVGEFTAPIKTSSGYYFFKLEEKKEAAFPELEKVQLKIRQQLFQRKANIALKKWISKLKESAFIEVKKYEREEKS